MEHTITIKKIEHINHNVLRIIADKPVDYSFTPGQATDLAIDKDGWRNEKRPFTFTSLPDDNDLEFTIKVYPSHEGVTHKLDDLKVGDSLLIGDAWGAIAYKGEGTFIAGGAGITPFLAILKDLRHKGQLHGNTLIFSNKKERDIILKNNLEAWLEENVHYTLSEEENDQYIHGRVDKALLEKFQLDITKPVYVCGPPPMMEAVTADLYAMGLSNSNLITEE